MEEEKGDGNAIRDKAKAGMSRRCMVIGAARKRSAPGPEMEGR